MNSRILRKLILITTLLVLSSAIAAAVYTQVKKSQPRGYPANVTAPPEVKSMIKGLEVVGVTLVDQGTELAMIDIDVINHRDEDVMAIDFVTGLGKNTSGGLAMDGLDPDNPVSPLVIIPRHSLKTFDFFLHSFFEGETIFIVAAIFSDGKEEGLKGHLTGIKQSRGRDQESKEKAKNGGPQ